MTDQSSTPEPFEIPRSDLVDSDLVKNLFREVRAAHLDPPLFPNGIGRQFCGSCGVVLVSVEDGCQACGAGAPPTPACTITDPHPAHQWIHHPLTERENRRCPGVPAPAAPEYCWVVLSSVGDVLAAHTSEAGARRHPCGNEVRHVELLTLCAGGMCLERVNRRGGLCVRCEADLVVPVAEESTDA